MRKNRFFVFFCVMVLVLGNISFISAESGAAMRITGADTGKVFANNEDYFILKNGKTVSFYVLPFGEYMLYPKEDAIGDCYRDILFDCEGPVRAKCSAGWVHIVNTRNEFILTLDINPSVKSRTATVTVTGKGYKARFKLNQFGRSTIKKIVRNKKTVTVKYRMARKAKKAFLEINIWKDSGDNDGAVLITKKAIELKPGKTSVKFKVAKQREYGVTMVTEYAFSKTRSGKLYTCLYEFYVGDATNTETIY